RGHQSELQRVAAATVGTPYPARRGARRECSERPLPRTVYERVGEKPRERIEREQGDHCQRAANRRGDERIAHDEAAQRETMTEQDERRRHDEQCAVTQSRLST